MYPCHWWKEKSFLYNVTLAITKNLITSCSITETHTQILLQVIVKHIHTHTHTNPHQPCPGSRNGLATRRHIKNDIIFSLSHDFDFQCQHHLGILVFILSKILLFVIDCASSSQVKGKWIDQLCSWLEYGWAEGKAWWVTGANTWETSRYLGKKPLEPCFTGVITLSQTSTRGLHIWHQNSPWKHLTNYKHVRIGFVS